MTHLRSGQSHSKGRGGEAQPESQNIASLEAASPKGPQLPGGTNSRGKGTCLQGSPARSCRKCKTTHIYMHLCIYIDVLTCLCNTYIYTELQK